MKLLKKIKAVTSMKKIFYKIKEFISFKNFFKNEELSHNLNEKISFILSYILPENLNETKKSFFLFWSIPSIYFFYEVIKSLINNEKVDGLYLIFSCINLFIMFI